MKNVAVTYCLALTVLIGSTGVSVALPQCAGSPTEDIMVAQKWDGCRGVLINANDKVTRGVWKSGRHQDEFPAVTLSKDTLGSIEDLAKDFRWARACRMSGTFERLSEIEDKIDKLLDGKRLQAWEGGLNTTDGLDIERWSFTWWTSRHRVEGCNSSDVEKIIAGATRFLARLKFAETLPRTQRAQLPADGLPPVLEGIDYVKDAYGNWRVVKVVLTKKGGRYVVTGTMVADGVTYAIECGELTPITKRPFSLGQLTNHCNSSTHHFNGHSWPQLTTFGLNLHLSDFSFRLDWKTSMTIKDSHVTLLYGADLEQFKAQPKRKKRLSSAAYLRSVTVGQKKNEEALARKEIDRLRRELAQLKKGRTQQPSVTKKAEQPPLAGRTHTSGSGFFVSKLGHVLTNEHLVRNCKNVTVGDKANRQVRVTVLEKDRRNDLALLKISSLKMVSGETKTLIRKLGVIISSKTENNSVPLSSNGLLRSEDVELGERLLVAGYPYGEIFSNTIKVTGGMVSAVRGMGNDSAQFQMDAAVQEGNSGGPIYDANGNIVGVVIAQLNRLKVAKTMGTLPELVNFGIKASTVRQFLTSSGLPTKWSQRSGIMSTRELATIARKQTVMVVCHQ